MSQWLVGSLPSAAVMALRASFQRPSRISDSISVSIFSRSKENSYYSRLTIALEAKVVE